MSSFEESSTGDLPGEQKQGVIEIPIPQEPDGDWCGLLSAAYGDGSFRTTIETASYLQQIFPTYGGLKSYQSHGCVMPGGELGKIDGLLVGAKMIPGFDNGPYVPHVLLVDVEQKHEPFWIYEHPDQEFLVPLSDVGDQLVVYPDKFN